MLRLCSIAVLLASTLACGCCLPALSGRCDQHCACEPAPFAAADGGALGCDYHGGHFGGRYGSAWLHRWPDFGGSRTSTPPGEVVPMPKFHPVPTRPVFEPLPAYLPPRSLRAQGRDNFTVPTGPTPELVPTPAQPMPDSA